jgi:hypothetical protein
MKRDISSVPTVVKDMRFGELDQTPIFFIMVREETPVMLQFLKYFVEEQEVDVDEPDKF